MKASMTRKRQISRLRSSQYRKSRGHYSDARKLIDGRTNGFRNFITAQQTFGHIAASRLLF